MTAAQPRAVTVGPGQSIPTYYRMLLRGQLTRGRIAGLVGLSAISIVLAIVSRYGFDPESGGIDAIGNYSIALLIPLSALMMATPMLGNLIDDRLLVYLWLKPVPRWHLAVAAFGAVVTVLIPVVLLPVAISAVATGIGSLVLPAIAAAALGVLAYSAVYLFLGVRLSWGLWLGLMYLVLWENILSRFTEGMARLSIRSYLMTILERGSDTPLTGAGRAGWASIVVPLAVAIVAVAVAAWTLHTRDVD